MQKGLCKHYNGSYHNKTCNAGVCYKDVTPDPDAPGCALRQPCRFESSGHMSPSQREHFERRGTCDKLEAPSAEELAAYEADIQKMIDNLMMSQPLISRVKKAHRGQNWSGIEECPVCKGRLHMTHAACNGHVHGKCETAGCLSWME